jgi:hypothetical protein
VFLHTSKINLSNKRLWCLKRKNTKKERIKRLQSWKEKKLPSPPEIGCLAEGTISTAWHVTQNTIK